MSYCPWRSKAELYNEPKGIEEQRLSQNFCTQYHHKMWKWEGIITPNGKESVREACVTSSRLARLIVRVSQPWLSPCIWSVLSLYALYWHVILCGPRLEHSCYTPGSKGELNLKWVFLGPITMSLCGIWDREPDQYLDFITALPPMNLLWKNQPLWAPGSSSIERAR